MSTKQMGAGLRKALGF